MALPAPFDPADKMFATAQARHRTSPSDCRTRCPRSFFLQRFNLSCCRLFYYPLITSPPQAKADHLLL